MKRTAMFAPLLVLTTLVFAAPLFAAQGWDDLVTGLREREAVREQGAAVLTELRSSAADGTEEQLWEMLWQGDNETRARAGMALMDKIFPDGDPANWEKVSGFLTPANHRPRQLAAIDGLFVTVSALAATEQGAPAAACLLEALGSTPHGKMLFIDEMPADLVPIVASIVERTDMKGDWTCKKIRGKMPLTPVFEGNVSRDTAESKRMQYLDGYGALASNGKYAWDRDRGYLYEVIESSGQILHF